MSISIATVLKLYKKDFIQQAIVDASDNKEIAVKYGQKGFGKRPDVIKYPRDVLEFAKRGATSFHCSEELWHNPLSIVTGMKSKELNELRKGWDLVLDIDCPHLKYSGFAAHLLIEALNYFGVNNLAVKFSGNHGFHIAVPFESFPETVSNSSVKDLFPEGPRRIAAFLQEKIRSSLGKMLLSSDSIDSIAKNVNKSPEELIKQGKFDPFEVLDIDTILISPRHLYRMPYSLNEKSGLVSIVVSPKQILSFDKQFATPDSITEAHSFLDRSKTVPGESKKLFVEAFDFKPRITQIIVDKPKEFEPVEEAVETAFFPPCIKKISGGLEDGKKRAVLILINFLTSVGWSYDMIEDYIRKWNKKNVEPLREVYWAGQLRYHKQQKKKAPAPNCDNKAYMKDMGVCVPDNFCQRIKNPVSYALRKSIMNSSNNKKVKNESNSKENSNKNASKRDINNDNNSDKNKSEVGVTITNKNEICAEGQKNHENSEKTSSADNPS